MDRRSAAGNGARPTNGGYEWVTPVIRIAAGSRGGTWSDLNGSFERGNGCLAATQIFTSHPDGLIGWFASRTGNRAPSLQTERPRFLVVLRSKGRPRHPF